MPADTITFDAEKFRMLASQSTQIGADAGQNVVNMTECIKKYIPKLGTGLDDASKYLKAEFWDNLNALTSAGKSLEDSLHGLADTLEGVIEALKGADNANAGGHLDPATTNDTSQPTPVSTTHSGGDTRTGSGGHRG